MPVNKNFLYLSLINLPENKFGRDHPWPMKQLKDFLPIKPVSFRQAHQLFFYAFKNKNWLLVFLYNLQSTFLTYPGNPARIVICSHKNSHTYQLVEVYFKKIQNLM